MTYWYWPTKRRQWPQRTEYWIRWPAQKPPPLEVGDHLAVYHLTSDHWLGLWQVIEPWRQVKSEFRLLINKLLHLPHGNLGPTWREVVPEPHCPSPQPEPLSMPLVTALWPALLDAQSQPSVRENGRLRPLNTLIPSPTMQARHLHDEIQMYLLKWGGQLGLKVHVARNDRQLYQSRQFALQTPQTIDELPQPFDPISRRIIEHIDILWLQENALIAAFEIECTTTVYSGLLRLTDLCAVQPHLHTPLYLVAPQRRLAKISRELHRPTFNLLVPPLAQRCRFLPWETLQKRLPELEGVAAYLKPHFLDQFTFPLDHPSSSSTDPSSRP